MPCGDQALAHSQAEVATLKDDLVQARQVAAEESRRAQERGDEVAVLERQREEEEELRNAVREELLAEQRAHQEARDVVQVCW